MGPRRPCASQAYPMNESRRNEWSMMGRMQGFRGMLLYSVKLNYVGVQDVGDSVRLV